MSIYVPEKNNIPRDQLRREMLDFAFKLLITNREHKSDVARMNNQKNIKEVGIKLEDILGLAKELETFVLKGE